MDLEGLLLLAAFYAVPFLVGLVMPGWKSLGVFALFVIAVGAWTFQPRVGGGLAGAAEAAIGLIIFMGAFAGLVGGSVKVWMNRSGPGGILPWLIGAGIGVLPVVLFFGLNPEPF